MREIYIGLIFSRESVGREDKNFLVVAAVRPTSCAKGRHLSGRSRFLVHNLQRLNCDVDCDVRYRQNTEHMEESNVCPSAQTFEIGPDS